MSAKSQPEPVPTVIVARFDQAQRATDESLARVQTELAEYIHAVVDSYARQPAEIIRDHSVESQRILMEHGQKLEPLAGAVQQHTAMLTTLTNEIRGLSEWTKVIARKHEMLALDVRERIPPQPEPDRLPEPTIYDADGMGAVIASCGGAVRLNLGCGEKPLPGYVNVDFRPVPGVHVVADVRRLPFEPGTVDEIASHHLVEHFRRHQMAELILPYWRQTLKPGGTLRIICPNWQAMLDHLSDGRMSHDVFRLVTFGGQDYAGDDHFCMYTPETLRELLEQTGFEQVQVIVADRQNGLCPEMEITAVRTN